MRVTWNLCQNMRIGDLLSNEEYTYGNCVRCFGIGIKHEYCLRDSCYEDLEGRLTCFHNREGLYINPWLIHCALYAGQMRSQSDEETGLNKDALFATRKFHFRAELPITGDDQTWCVDEFVPHIFKLLWFCYVHSGDFNFHLKHVMNEAATGYEIFYTALDTMVGVYYRLRQNRGHRVFDTSQFLNRVFPANMPSE